ncbi:MAG: TIGR02147 family protein [Fibrobacteria bacterium]|nr:TIGR02147 family protein [Fibrobacteria bacterium]
MNEKIWEYSDYRQALGDFLVAERSLRPQFSLRWFAQRAGFSSHSFPGLLVAGKRNLGEDGLERLAKALRLKGRAATYFRALVRHNQSRTPQEREITLEALKKLRAGRDAHRLRKDQWEYYDRWWHPVVRELAVYADWRGEFGRLGAMLSPAISADQARASVELLERLKLLEKVGDSRWAQTDAVVSAADVPGTVLKEARTQYLLRAVEASERLPPTDRHASWAVLAMGRKSYQEVTKLLDEVRQKALAEAVLDQDVDGIYVVSLQAFPVGRWNTRGVG